jgi:dihydroneopterin aldolase
MFSRKANLADVILIEDLEISSRIGAGEDERREPQRLTVSLVMETARALTGLGDDLSQTVDYFRVCEAVKGLALERPRALVETLAEEIATLVLRDFAVCGVTVELRKYILADTRWVAVRLRRPL